jgi:alkanesulfonate monooxygenase SsuD/methylene tetrahydromethanopterin reductase-like flavin-dependent oxidoreductase (luciferase family)
MLAEAVSIIRTLLDGGYVNFEGAHFGVDAAKLGCRAASAQGRPDADLLGPGPG